MAEETTRQFLDRRTRELRARISALKGQLAPLEAELLEAERMIASLTLAGGNTNALLSRTIALSAGVLSGNALSYPPQVTLGSGDSPFQYSNALQKFLEPSSGSPTIKQLVVQTLLDHFPTGAPSAEIRDYIRAAYQRTIEPSSLRPQLRRLKADGKLVHDPSTDTWDLTPSVRRGFRWYDHPSSQEVMLHGLEDEPPEPE